MMTMARTPPATAVSNIGGNCQNRPDDGADCSRKFQISHPKSTSAVK